MTLLILKAERLLPDELNEARIRMLKEVGNSADMVLRQYELKGHNNCWVYIREEHARWQILSDVNNARWSSLYADGVFVFVVGEEPVIKYLSTLFSGLETIRQ